MEAKAEKESTHVQFFFGMPCQPLKNTRIGGQLSHNHGQLHSLQQMVRLTVHIVYVHICSYNYIPAVCQLDEDLAVLMREEEGL